MAYRLEPLILKHYSSLRPLKIHRHDNGPKPGYCEMPAEAYSPIRSPPKKEIKKVDKSSAEENSDSDSKGSSISGRLGSMWARFSKKSTEEQLSAEMEKIENSAQAIEDRIIEKERTERQKFEKTDETDLEYRLDFQLQEGSLENSYLAALTSHTAYWTNPDIALFILTNVYPDYPPDTP